MDPIKANEVPIPRGSTSKKRRVSDEDQSASLKRMKYESSYDDEFTNGGMHGRHSLPHQFTGGSSFLQDIAYSAQQALDRTSDVDLVPVDPALQAYTNGDYDSMDMANSYPVNDDTIMSSVECPPTDSALGRSREHAHSHNEAHGPSIEPLTPDPLPHNVTDVTHTSTNGYTGPHHAGNHAVRHPSSPVSPRHISVVSPYHPYLTSHSIGGYNNFTTDSDFPPPPITPTMSRPRKTPRSSKTPKSTANGRRRDSKENIKLENGISMSTGMGVNELTHMGNGALFSHSSAIDPNLDQASIDLIKQLQQEDLGLRRRSR